MLPKYSFSLFAIWQLVIFIFFVTQSLGFTDFIKRDPSLDRSNVPKNILATSVAGESHLPSMLEICKILMDRGYNV